jgi:hypothetical protein
MKLFWRRLVNWLAIVMGALTVGFCVLLWRDDRRYEDFWSCKNQSHVRTDLRAGPPGSDQNISARTTPADNLLIDDCMVKRGHSINDGLRTGKCANERDNLCYSVL